MEGHPESEITKRVRELEDALKASGEMEDRLQAIVSASSDLFFVMSRDGVYLDYHARDESILFTPPSRFLGKSVLETLPEEVAVPYQNAISQSVQENRTVTLEYPLPICGDTKHFEARIHPLNSERVCVIIRDITSRVKAEHSLRSSDLRFRQIANTVDEVFWIGEPFTARAIYISPAWERIYGAPAAEIYADSSNWLKYIHPEDRDKVQAEFVRAINTGLMDIEHRIIRPDKTMRWVRTRSFPIHDQDGTLFRMSGIAQDITAFKAAEEELRLSKLQLEERVRARTKDLALINRELKSEIENRKRSEERFRTVTDTVPAIVAVHRGGKYLYVNQATCSITGFSMEELLAMNFWELASPEHQAILKNRGLGRLRGEDPPSRYEIQIFTKSG
ncbi:MAG: PAS domain S-box protein, partial [Bdellovibrionales bacterium]|nr:PAS domain S-box protein [Bdellovibrionales bacterium]